VGRVLALVMAAPAPAAVVPLSQIGRTGDAAGDLRRPIGVAIDTQRRGTWLIRAPKAPRDTRSCLRPAAKKPGRRPL